MAFWNRSRRGEARSTTFTGEIPATTSTVTVLKIDDVDYDPSNPAHRRTVAEAEALTGTDLDGDGRVAERPVAPEPAPEPVAADPISQLERLQALRVAGALTEDEFAEQKRRVLDAG